ncbi:MAG TPA: M14 family zinc carboxypeptidase, partial [Saprospiraceae bacterium]|nr:M14 family zinc carboxypeptidase [Saprospiraceae bacterium]
FTPHHLLVDYFHYIDAQTDKVQVIQYGQTYEYRPLIVAIISSPANMKRLETIRQNNLKRTGMMDGKVTDDSIAIVYISCSIHGNEAAGSESSMEVLYDLAKGGDPYDAWLKHALVILDPSLNPDGYERFTQYSNSLSASPNDPRPEVREHNEPWPGGRFNHYDTDLNRDWAWQTQQETRARIAFYLQWMPHVHADLHEMEADASYYFAPAAQPYHPYLTAWQVECQKIIGQNHAHHFDEKGWRYYTKERFDLFYPGYGDTYPIFAGSIGMTYEQGGAAYGDRAILLDNGDTLTLSDRIAHHREATLSTIEVAAQNAERLDREFEAFYQSSRTSPPGHVKSYVIRGQNNPGKIEDLLALLRLNKIQFGQAKENRIGLKGFRFSSGQQDQFDVQEGDLVIPVAQPRSVLLQVLFEPEAKLSDSLTYDITAWSLPMAYGLDAFSTDEAVDYTTWQNQASSRMMESVHPVAYAVEWGSVPSAQLLIRMIKGGLVARYALEAFTVNGKEFAPGTILLMRSDNQHHPQFDVLIKDLAAGSVVPVTPISTGFVESGKDLGSNSYPLIRRPEVLAISGDEMNPTSLGEAWHYFEEELDYPIHFVNLHELDRANL